MKPVARAGPNRRQLIGLTLAAAASAGMIGCSDIAPWRREPPRLFRLTPKNAFGGDLPVVSWQLVLDRPIAATGLDTTRIGLMRSPTELEYYAEVGWTDSATEMILTLLIESFENSKKIVSVGRDTVLLRSDFVLATELREFQAEYFHSGLPEPHVHINAKLVKMPERTIIAAHSVEAREQATADDIELIILAFDEALGKVLKGVVEWTLVSGSKAAEQAEAAA
jgi:cholesterol transport system auxiliary component